MSSTNNAALMSHTDENFNQVFTHQNALINGFNMHYVAGGKGKLLLLLHGYPQTWYAWRHLMPELAKHYQVVAADLRGFGDSEKNGGWIRFRLAERGHSSISESLRLCNNVSGWS